MINTIDIASQCSFRKHPSHMQNTVHFICKHNQNRPSSQFTLSSSQQKFPTEHTTLQHCNDVEPKLTQHRVVESTSIQRCLNVVCSMGYDQFKFTQFQLYAHIIELLNLLHRL